MISKSLLDEILVKIRKYGISPKLEQIAHALEINDPKEAREYLDTLIRQGMSESGRSYKQERAVKAVSIGYHVSCWGEEAEAHLKNVFGIDWNGDISQTDNPD